MKPNIVFFSRSYQAKLFPLLQSDKYESIHVALTLKDKAMIEKQGGNVDYCFELYTGSVDHVQNNYLKSSFFSDRFMGGKKIEYRLKFLKREIAFWREIFDIYNPVAVVNEQVAIEIAEVMYIEAERKGIKYLAWMSNPINGYFYWIANPMSLSLTNNTINIEPSSKSIAIAKNYINKIIYENERPYYLNPYLNVKKYKQFLGSVKGLIRYYLRNRLFRKQGEYEDFYIASKDAFKRNFYAFFKNYTTLEELNGNEIVLYPLHYEPEASLSYLSEFYGNQVALIENISKCLGVNQILVVKEHPAQQGMLSTPKYRKLLGQVSNLYYLSDTVSSFKVIKQSQLIITLTSHLGWEALILGKPVYLLGKMFYDKYPYVNLFTNWERLRKSIREKDYLYPTNESIVKFTAQLLDISYEGYPFMGGGTLYEKENLKKIVYALECELNKIMINKN